MSINVYDVIWQVVNIIEDWYQPLWSLNPGVVWSLCFFLSPVSASKNRGSVLRQEDTWNNHITVFLTFLVGKCTCLVMSHTKVLNGAHDAVCTVIFDHSSMLYFSSIFFQTFCLLYHLLYNFSIIGLTPYWLLNASV